MAGQSIPTTTELLSAATQALTAGQAVAALDFARQALASAPAHVEALNIAGNAALQTSDFAAAAEYFSVAVRVAPASKELHFNLGVSFDRAGNGADAADAYSKALSIDPSYVPACLNMANAYAVQRDFAGARQILETCAARMPAPDLRVLRGLGAISRAEGRTADAVHWFRRANELQPSIPILSEIAQLHLADGDIEAAAHTFSDALALEGDAGSARLAEVQALFAAGRYQEAYAGLSFAKVPLPGIAAILNMFGVLWERLGKRDEALLAYEALAVAQPDHGDALRGLVRLGRSAVPLHQHLRHHPRDDQGWLAVSDAAYRQARYGEAISVLEEGITRSGSTALRLHRAMLLPKVPTSLAEIVDARRTMADQLDAIIHGDGRVNDVTKQLNRVQSLLPYAGLPNRDLQRKFAAAHRAAAPDLTWTAPHCTKPRAPRARIRIGFVSHYLTLHHTIRRLFIAMIGGLDRKRFEVIAVAPAAKGEPAETVRYFADRVVALPPTLEDARRTIADLELDLLIYPDIGMTASTYYLAFARLAPVQAVFFGHPMTTGLDTIDYFISSDLKEPADGHDHYSEKLVLVPRMPVFYPRPSRDFLNSHGPAIDRPPKATLYACPQTVIKFHPDFDRMLAGILAADPHGKLALIKIGDEAWFDLLFARMAESIPDLQSRLVLLPPLPVEEYYGLLGRADAVLDPYPFCGGNSSYEAFAVGAPVVTLPGPTMCGRLTDAFYRQMGLPEMVSTSPEDYVARAVRIANDKVYRREQSAAIAARDHEIFDDRKALALIEDVFAEVSRVA